MSVRCRSCLLNNKPKYFSLLAVLNEFGNNSILDLLSFVTSSRINYWKDLPEHICLDCLNKLRIAYNFIMQFNTNQTKLIYNPQKNTNKDNKNINGNDIEAVVKKEDENIKEILNSANTDRILIVNEDGTIYDDSDDEDEIFGSLEFKDQKDEHIQSLELDPANYLKVEAVYVKEGKVEEEFQTDNESTEEPTYTKDDKSSIKIVTVEDVIKSDMQKRSEKTKKMSVEDVLKAVKPKKKIKKDHDDEQIFYCSICQKVFSTIRNLRIHKMAVHNPNWEKKFKCDVCGLKLTTVSKYKHHMSKHTNLRFRCDHDQCDKEYITKSKLKEHIRNKHEDTLENKYLCTICGRGFKYSHALSYHLKIHTNSKNYVCRFCAHSFIALSGLKRHERTHTGERPYECKYCKKTFAGAPEKNNHENRHGGVFKYQCSYCEKPYVQDYNMKVHWMQHRGPYECEVCKKGYADAEILKFHYAHTHKIKDVVIEEVEVDTKHEEMDDLSQ